MKILGTIIEIRKDYMTIRKNYMTRIIYKIYQT